MTTNSMFLSIIIILLIFLVLFIVYIIQYGKDYNEFIKELGIIKRLCYSHEDSLDKYCEVVNTLIDTYNKIINYLKINYVILKLLFNL